MANWKATTALVVVAGGLAAYAYFVEGKKEPPPADSNITRFWKAKEDKTLTRLTVKDATGSEAVYLRKPGQEGSSAWYFSKRATDSLIGYEWDSAFGALADLQSMNTIEPNSKNAASFGLDKPWLTVTLGDDKKSDRYKVMLGYKMPLDTVGVYAQVAGDPKIYAVEGWRVDGWKKLLYEPPIAVPSPAVPSPAFSAEPAKK